VVKEMSKRAVVKALNANGCRKARDDGDHEWWICPCGQHGNALPRHSQTTAGVIRSFIRRMECLPKGWLQ